MTSRTQPPTTDRAPSLELPARAPAASPRDVERLPAWRWLALGAAATLLTGPRWGIALLAWVAMVPYLLYARRARTWRAWLALLATLLVAYPLQLLQIITPPIPAALAVPFGLPAALGAFATLAYVELVRRRAGELPALAGFAALVATLDWVGYGASPLGAWSTTANSQVEQLGLLQLASVTGLWGIGLAIAWVNATLAYLIAAPRPVRRAPAVVAAVGLLAVLLAGALRVERAVGGTAVTVAAVVTDLGLSDGLPDDDALAANTDVLFERTRVAAARGARLVVWNEAATLVAPAAEEPLLARARAQARALGIDLVLAYAVIVSASPLSLDNQYALVTSEGDIAHRYRKHHPVPGEPSLRGTAPIEVITRPYGRLAGAICYDYDFPSLARQHALQRADLVFVPASDWRGIDPVHTLMTRVRAIEGGFSVVRATRWAASAAFDPHGQIRGWMSVTEQNDRIMIATVPIGRIPTVYRAIGDAPVALTALVALAALGLVARRRRRS
ncbi:MAG: nitrilase-related carbon-nitrogen hydrolase [Kofleriaceae bacterium]